MRRIRQDSHGGTPGARPRRTPLRRERGSQLAAARDGDVIERLPQDGVGEPGLIDERPQVPRVARQCLNPGVEPEAVELFGTEPAARGRSGLDQRDLAAARLEAECGRKTREAGADDDDAAAPAHACAGSRRTSIPSSSPASSSAFASSAASTGSGTSPITVMW